MAVWELKDSSAKVIPAKKSLSCRFGRCFCLRQRSPPETRTPTRATQAALCCRHILHKWLKRSSAIIVSTHT
nr:MAG TPA: hypothetical protein [Caudoviricetes sp.]